MSKFTLTEIELEEALSEIITGKKIFYYKNEAMCICQPTSKDRDSARTIYIGKYRELEAIGLPKKEDLKLLLLKKGLLQKDFYVQKNNIESEIEKNYIAREKTGSAVQLAQIDAQINMLYGKLIELEEKEEIIMINCLEYNAESYRLNYMLSRIVLTGIELEDRKWKTYEDFRKENDAELVFLCKKKYREISKGLEPKMIRAVARSQEWKRRWEIAKKTGSQVFDGVSSDWDKNKVNLCYWSNFYDNIIENLKLRSLDILEDDDAFFEMIRKANNGQREEDNTSTPGKKKVLVKTPYKVRY
jgi:hypothetical protein